MPGTRVNPARVASVLDGVLFPAKKWQLIAQADYCGTDSQFRAELGRLPIGVYADLDAVLSGLQVLSDRSASPTTRTCDKLAISTFE
jgi:hypothetical protein